MEHTTTVLCRIWRNSIPSMDAYSLRSAQCMHQFLCRILKILHCQIARAKNKTKKKCVFCLYSLSIAVNTNTLEEMDFLKYFFLEKHADVDRSSVNGVGVSIAFYCWMFRYCTDSYLFWCTCVRSKEMERALFASGDKVFSNRKSVACQILFY